MFWAGLFMLTLYCIALFTGSLLSGLLPTTFTLTPQNMALFNTFGSGLLTGTAFLVIIPEGLHMLFSPHSTGDTVWAFPYIGIAMLSGFVVMVIIEKLTHVYLDKQGKCSNTHPFSSLLTPACVSVLIHNLTDGWALGLVSLADNTSQELLVFLAILMHKAPTTFSIGSMLTAANTPMKTITTVVGGISAAAPLSALVTYVIVHCLAGAVKTNDGIVGLCLIFSGGTFLYTIAAHILPSILDPTSAHSHTSSHDYNMVTESEIEMVEDVNAHSHGSGTHSHNGDHGHSHAQPRSSSTSLGQKEWGPYAHIITLILGCVVPMLLGGHSHH